MRVSVFVGVSVDGFLARPDGALDFLPQESEPHGYDEFIATVDAIVIGRKTYETVLGFSDWPYGARRIVVLSSQPLDLTIAVERGGFVEQASGDERAILERLSASGARHVYVDGGITIQRFLRAGLVTDLVVTLVPVLIGEGIPLFGSIPHDIPLNLRASRSYPSGLVQVSYEVIAP